MKILFICMSNICRSPFCEYVFRRMVSQDEVLSGNVEWVKSSAVFNKSFKINSKAVPALLREGFEESYILAHEPTFKYGKGKKYFEEADVIIGMTRSNKFFLPIKYRKKFVLLSEIATGQYKPISDPVLIKDIEKYYAAMDVIKDYLHKYAEILKSEFIEN